MHSIDQPPVKNSGEERKKFKRFIHKGESKRFVDYIGDFDRWLACNFDRRNPKVVHQTREVIGAPHTCHRSRSKDECYACVNKLRPVMRYLVEVELDSDEGQRIVDYFAFGEVQYHHFIKHICSK